MARFPILGQIAAAVAEFLAAEFKRAGVKADVSDALPEAQAKAPRVHFVMFDTRQNLDRRETEAVSEQERLKDGTVIDYLRDPPIFLDLGFLLFADGPPTEAHAALAKAVLLLKDHPILDDLPALKELYVARDETLALRLLHGYEATDVTQIMHRMGIPARPALVYGCSARIESEKRREVRRVEERILDIEQKERP